MNITTCPVCGVTYGVGGFPFCKGGHAAYSIAVGHDEIPGGLWVENLGPVPIKVYSHSERRRIAKARGLEEVIRHVPLQGSDKSPYTTSWATMDPYTLEQARILAERQAHTRASEPDRGALETFRKETA